MIYTLAMPVACVPLLPCFTCPECLKGFYSQCAKYDFIGSRRDGGLAEYIVVKRKNVFALPTDMPIGGWGLLLSRLPLACMLFI
ncbi:galactitol-1-phosphate 5-dehydrogenase [Escherichia coli]|nr:galactitol-1-phosphate 5-dehydrogenase [Escherichia coli]